MKQIPCVVDVGGTTLCITNSMSPPLLVAKMVIDFNEKEHPFISKDI